MSDDTHDYLQMAINCLMAEGADNEALHVSGARDTITAFRAEVERLRAALESIADLPPCYADMKQDDLVIILADKARAALNTQEPT
jgi:phosphopentomutase